MRVISGDSELGDVMLPRLGLRNGSKEHVPTQARQ